MLLVEDDEAFADVTVALLGSVARVTRAQSGEEVAALAQRRWDLVIADVELPGITGIELIAAIKATSPLVATLILSGHATFDYAVAAIRAGADDYMTKPVEPQALVAKVVELIALTHARMLQGHEVVLAIGAHPDDVEIGIGGILLRHVAAGHELAVLTLTGGEAGGVPTERALEAGRAAEMMSARLFLTDLKDTSVGEGGTTIAAIKHVIDETAPTTIYTHTAFDVHQDHRNVNRATLVAARRTPRVYCYQAPSTSIDYRPTRFVGIDAFLDRKLEVIRAYASQVASRPYLDEELLRATARYWSRFAQSRYAEPLEVVRDTEREDAAGAASATDDRRTPEEVTADVS